MTHNVANTLTIVPLVNKMLFRIMVSPPFKICSSVPDLKKKLNAISVPCPTGVAGAESAKPRLTTDWGFADSAPATQG